jgi:nucleotide-binding universal stress UspA family protein
VCGVDGSRSGRYAVEQAIALSSPGTALVFVCVRVESGSGAAHQATITSERASGALRQAVKAAAEAGVEATSEVLTGADPAPVLLEEASRSDLLVVASHGGSRAGGIVLGSTASNAVHRASIPVLVARRPPAADAAGSFPHRVLVAADGSRDAARAIELTARIARRGHSRVYLLSVEPERHGDPKQIAVQAVELTDALGEEPTVLRAAGHPQERVIEVAAEQSASLVVVGSRGLGGVHALGSVSERVAHRAPCSVLVARPA